MPGVTRKYQHTPGIDAVGEIENSSNTDFKEGDKVIVTGYDLGMNTAGVVGQYIRVPAKWVCLLYPSDAADEEDCVGLGGGRMI